MASIVYNRGKAALIDGTAPGGWPGSGVFRVLLVGAGYTPDADHQFVSQITNELTGSTYSRKTLTGRTVTVDNATDRVLCDAADPVFSTLNAGAVAAAVVYLQVGGDDSTPADDILIYCGDNPDLVSNGGDVTMQWSNSPACLFYF
jgi:hypothetical protein